METPITQSIAGVASSLSVVDRKITSLLKTNQDEILRSIQTQVPKLRRTLHSLSTQLQGPSNNNSVLTSVTSEGGTLFEFTVMTLMASINTLRQLESSVRNVKRGGEKKSLLKKAKEAVTDTDLLVFKEKLQLLDTALRVVMQLITIHLSTTLSKINIHDERVHLRNIADTVAQIQSSTQIIASLRGEAESRASPSAEQFSRICSQATQLVHTESRRVEAEVTLNHSGFVPMSPLVEVKTNNTLMPSISTVSTLGI